MLMASLAGCGADTSQEPQAKEIREDVTPSGVVMLSVNPEVAVFYDNNGKVETIEARNADAQEILKGYTDYQGRDTREVISELVDRIGQAGYFTEEIENEDGTKGRRIDIELEPGSYLPSATFLQDVVDQAKASVEKAQWNGVVYQLDYDAEDYITATGPEKLDNDDVEIFFDENGKVTRVISRDDGMVLAEYTGFAGKDIKQATLELIDKIEAEGCFVKEIESNGHRVEIEAVPNQQLPENVTAAELNQYVRQQVENAQWNGTRFVIDCDIENMLGFDIPDLDDRYDDDDWDDLDDRDDNDDWDDLDDRYDDDDDWDDLDDRDDDDDWDDLDDRDDDDDWDD